MHLRKSMLIELQSAVNKTIPKRHRAFGCWHVVEICVRLHIGVLDFSRSFQLSGALFMMLFLSSGKRSQVFHVLLLELALHIGGSRADLNKVQYSV